MFAPKHRRALLLTSCVLVAAALGVALRGFRPGDPADLPALPERAEAAGWRVVPVSAGQGARGGFYALPPGDARGLDEMSTLPLLDRRWGGAIFCCGAIKDMPPEIQPTYRGDDYEIYGEVSSVRDFA